jgi:hypothetical protein
MEFFPYVHQFFRDGKFLDLRVKSGVDGDEVAILLDSISAENFCDKFYAHMLNQKATFVSGHIFIPFLRLKN